MRAGCVARGWHWWVRPAAAPAIMCAYSAEVALIDATMKKELTDLLPFWQQFQILVTLSADTSDAVAVPGPAHQTGTHLHKHHERCNSDR